MFPLYNLTEPASNFAISQTNAGRTPRMEKINSFSNHQQLRLIMDALIIPSAAFARLTFKQTNN